MGRRILIAEDESRLAAFVAKGLKKHGYDVVIAEDGQQALEISQQEAFGLILLDLGLPVKDGWAVLIELRQQETQVPVIIVTAMSDNGNKDRAIALGANDFMTKPFRFNVLLTKVRSYFEP
ncbi:MAG: response regulator [Leptolyngbyaceae cyanobacterium CSU_1_3]|nr:response regulator [Leptolyngbyaceae cyanobacterium CSU_1_3]